MQSYMSAFAFELFQTFAFKCADLHLKPAFNRSWDDWDGLVLLLTRATTWCGKQALQLGLKENLYFVCFVM